MKCAIKNWQISVLPTYAKGKESKEHMLFIFCETSSAGFISSSISIISCTHTCCISKWERNALFHKEVTRISNPSLTSCDRQEAHYFMGNVDPNLGTVVTYRIRKWGNESCRAEAVKI
jgi:hypothetical protein